MGDKPVSIDQAYVCDIARNRLGEIRQLIQIVRKQGVQSEDLLLADHLLSMSALAFEELAEKVHRPARR